MGLDCYQLRAQLGAGPDGVAYQATASDGVTPVEVLDLSRALSDPIRWPSLARRLRLAAQLTHPSAKPHPRARSRARISLRGPGADR